MLIIIFFISIILIFTVLAINHESNKKETVKKYSELKLKTDKLKAENEYFTTLRKPIIHGNEKGREFEKEGDIIKAIDKYEQTTKYIKDNITALSPHIPIFGLERLMILYRKNNKEKEKIFIEDCIKTFNNIINDTTILKWQTRFDKLK